MSKTDRKESVRRALLAVMAALLTVVATLFLPLGGLQYRLGDYALVRQKAVDNRIKIIGIDEVSLREMGPFAEWSRQQAADLLNAFEEAYAPTVVAFDINYFGNKDLAGDEAFAKAAARCKNVVVASYLEYSAKLEVQPDGKLQMNTMYLEQMEKPYEALEKVTRQGFTNAVQDVDNYVRRSLLLAEWQGETGYNFAYEIYRFYMERTGGEALQPRTDKAGSYGFDYTAEPGMYDVYSYVDVISGRVDAKVFKDSIVLVGAYASGMMDQYMVPIAHNTVMNGVEVQANHVNALLDGRTFVEIPDWGNALLAAVLVGSYVYLALTNQISFALIGGAVLEVLVITGAQLLYKNGFYWKWLLPCAIPPIVLVVRVFGGYLTERFKKRRILNMFRTYMAPQVVDELGKSKNYQIELGGKAKDIAVLFVDIRGFTALSERLEPTQVVEILNRYLGGVTDAIFQNQGTLDKFIGDAVMAVYNAPLDVEGYCEKAVRTGLDIVRAVEALNGELRKDFQVEISCGVGIHSGKAVVGNIGCSCRMDYTAIGDTVNVASRLEGIAGPGQVLISGELYEKVKGFMKAEYIGEKKLKGRADCVNVYALEGLNETSVSG